MTCSFNTEKTDSLNRLSNLTLGGAPFAGQFGFADDKPPNVGRGTTGDRGASAGVSTYAKYGSGEPGGGGGPIGRGACAAFLGAGARIGVEAALAGGTPG
jgi:hypothetical protein